MLAKNVNDNACFLKEPGACEFFASKLAPTFERIATFEQAVSVTTPPAFNYQL